MAYLTIVTGTHEFLDHYGIMRNHFLKNPVLKYTVNGVSFKKRRFDRVIINKKGQVITLPPIMAFLGGHKYAINQTMGSGKTILAMEHLARTHRDGGRTGANMSVEWFPSNQGKPREEWIPNLNSIEDLEKAKNITIAFDDLKGTIKKWNSQEADMIGAIVNASRKESVNIIITTQRVVNFVPKDFREVCNNYEIPYITIRDQRIESPDKMGFPLEMEVFNISANGVFLGFGVYNGYIADGKTLRPNPKLLNAYHTLEIAQNLGDPTAKAPPLMENTELEPYSGYNNEVDVIRELEKYAGEVKHLSADNPREHKTDIIFNDGKIWHIDAVALTKYKKGQSTYYKLETKTKDLMDLWQRAQAQGIRSLLAFKYKNKIRFLDIKHLATKSGNVDYGKELKAKTKMSYALFKPRPPD